MDDDEYHWTEHQLTAPALSQGVSDAMHSDLDTIKVHDNLHTVIKSLPDRLRDIIQARYLMEEKVTLQRLADQWGVSIERVRQLEKQALVQMKKVMDDE